MATIKELTKEWDGTPATLKRRRANEEHIVIWLGEGGRLHLSERNTKVTLGMLVDDEWLLKYPAEFDPENVIRALILLNPEMSDLLRPEWYDFQRRTAIDTIYAVCRSLGIIINGKLEWKNDN